MATPMVRTLCREGLRLLAAVGFVSLLPPTARADDGLEVTVVSYNVFAVPYVASSRSVRVHAIADELAELQPDVVALQELWTPEDEVVMARTLAAQGLVHQRHLGPRDGGGGAGLWLGSRFPIVSEDFTPFSAGGLPWVPWHLDWLVTKGVVIHTLRTPLGPLRVANTHLQSSYEIGDYTSVQISQALEVADAIGACGAEVCRGAHPLIVVGDLNDRPQSLTVRALTQRAGLVPVNDTLELDHVFSRAGGTVSVRLASHEAHLTAPVRLTTGEQLSLSDHPCLVTRFQLNRCEQGCGVVSAVDSWSDVARQLRQRATTKHRSVAMAVAVSRIVGVGLLLVAGWAVAGARWARSARERRRKTFVTVVTVALMLAVWLLYLGWWFYPAQLSLLHSQQTGDEP